MPSPPLRIRFSLAALFLSVTLVGLALGSILAWQMYQRRAQLSAVFGGEQGLVILTDPDKTKAYRLKAP